MLTAAPVDENPLAAEMDRTYDYFLSRGYISEITRWTAVIAFISRTLASRGNAATFAQQLFSGLPELRTFNEGDLLTDEPVTVITVHKAKGLEFDNVIVYNASRIETARGGDDARVYYVAFSRARRRLAVFHTGRPSAPVATVSHMFEHISPDEVEAMSLLERLHSRPATLRR